MVFNRALYWSKGCGNLLGTVLLLLSSLEAVFSPGLTLLAKKLLNLVTLPEV